MTESTREENLKTIRDACLLANPEIVEEHSLTSDMDNSRGYVLHQCLTRDIHLSDVLLAIGKTKCPEHGTFNHLALSTYGEFYNSYRQKAAVLATWNLRKTLDDQEDATLQFLADVLDSKGI